MCSEKKVYVGMGLLLYNVTSLHVYTAIPAPAAESCLKSEQATVQLFSVSMSINMFQ